MSFLAPLYLAGLLGVSLPIILHLIRRSPQGRQLFSSLMFLSSSPPRITRRSRLENLLLLLLRALALILLAVAFARPFLRSEARLDFSSVRGRRVAVLIDVSASMRRADVWRQAQDEVETILRDLEPVDHVALIAFDDQPRMVSGWELEGQPESSAAAREQVRQGLKLLAPGWRSTDLGAALTFASDALVQTNDQRGSDAAMQVIVVSDLQQGARIDALQSYEWPASVRAEFRLVAPVHPGNASVRVAEIQATDEPADENDSRFRLRVANSPDARREQFRAYWASEAGPVGDPVSVQAPPGQTRVVGLPAPPLHADRVILEGDDADFDNVFYFAPRKPRTLSAAFWMDDEHDDPLGLRYYVQRVLASRPDRELDLKSHSLEAELGDADLLEVQLVVARDAIPLARQARLRRWIENGGVALLVLSSPADSAQLEALTPLLDEPKLQLSEVKAQPYSIWSDINFRHPLFAPLSTASYSDFTQMRFWGHRRLENLPEDIAVVARFDNGDPAVLDYAWGAGHLLIMTAGWLPDESQLARTSAKFIPLVEAMANMAMREQWRPATGVVGQLVSLPAAHEEPWRLLDRPDGLDPSTLASQETPSFVPQQPGLYRARAGSAEFELAVNFDGAESETAPRDPEELEPAGVLLGTQTSQSDEIRRSRHQQDVELEGQQKAWRWLLVAVLGLLVAETWVAHRAARKSATAASTAG